jgi:hypothetical protein
MAVFPDGFCCEVCDWFHISASTYTGKQLNRPAEDNSVVGLASTPGHSWRYQ